MGARNWPGLPASFPPPGTVPPSAASGSPGGDSLVFRSAHITESTSVAGDDSNVLFEMQIGTGNVLALAAVLAHDATGNGAALTVEVVGSDGTTYAGGVGHVPAHGDATVVVPAWASLASGVTLQMSVATDNDVLLLPNPSGGQAQAIGTALYALNLG